MHPLLTGKRALVTGAGSGIGAGIATAMAQAGAEVIVVDRNAVAALQTADRIGGKAYALDVTDRQAVMALATQISREVGPISVLVNNAGIVRRGKVEDLNAPEDWDATLAVNLTAPYMVTLSFMEQLKVTKGCVINIGSIQSFIALPNSAAYTASKGGVRLLTQALAIELSPQGVRVNAIGPGLIATPLNETARQNPAFLKTFDGRIPIGRLGTPEDIAGPAVFLASDLAQYVTGVTLPVDGGFLAG